MKAFNVGCTVLYFVSSLVNEFRQELKQESKQANKNRAFGIQYAAFCKIFTVYDGFDVMCTKLDYSGEVIVITYVGFYLMAVLW